MGLGGMALYAPAVVYCPLPKKSLGNPCLKILDFFLLFVADAPLLIENASVKSHIEERFQEYFGQKIIDKG